MKITFLGTGTSHGVPPIDCMLGSPSEVCYKGVCRKSIDDPRHRRTRTSILLQKFGKTLIADVSPDFREQALRERIMNIDAILLSHGHIDHFGGLPDIRSYTEKTPLNIYSSRETLDNITTAFPYMFEIREGITKGIPRLIPCELSPFVCADILGFNVVPIPVKHGTLDGCFGFRIDDVGYVPDVKIMSEESMGHLLNLDCLILNCLRDEREHRTHLILQESIELARKLKPKKCYFIHMTHHIDYEVDSVHLDDWMEFSFDGLTVEV